MENKKSHNNPNDVEKLLKLTDQGLYGKEDIESRMRKKEHNKLEKKLLEIKKLSYSKSSIPQHSNCFYSIKRVCENPIPSNKLNENFFPKHHQSPLQCQCHQNICQNNLCCEFWKHYHENKRN